VELPAAWIAGNRDLWPRAGRVLDVACGKGRHALVFARAGLHVRAIDRSADAIAALGSESGRLGLAIDTAVVDLETDPPPSLGDALYDAIVVCNYLHRPLMPAIRAAVKPGGRIFYETFTTRQAERGTPRNPAFLLREGELRELIAPFAVLRWREGDIDGRFIASVVAERPRQIPGPPEAQITL
jgi:SAM-dependent methyltransferase